MIKVAVFGYGHLGRWHVDKVIALKEEGLSELVAVIDPSETTKAKLEEKGINVPIFKNREECDLDFDAAIVVTPTSFHYEVCKGLLEEGKHVFCEKPMTSTYEQSLELQKIIKDKGVKFQVGHSERFHAIWSKVKEEKNFFTGSPILRLERQAPFKGRATDVDVVQDLMIHDIDLVMFTLGETPNRVRAYGKKQRTDKWDFARAVFDFNSGAQATISVGRNHVNEVRMYEVVNNSGALQVDLMNKKMSKALSSATEETQFVVEEEYTGRDHLLEEQRCFYQSIKNDSETVVTAQDGINAVFIVEQVLKSLESNQDISW